MILVVGATGDLGGAVTKMLLAKGKEVRVLAREKSNYRSLKEAGAKVVFGDLKIRASLEPAFENVDTIVTTANSAQRGGDDNPETVDLQGNRNLIDTARTAGVKHFIFVSAQVADPNSPVPFLHAKGRTEEYLQASGIPYTIIAPDLFMDVWVVMVVASPAIAQQPVTLVGSGNRKHSFISRADVARFIVASINNPKAVNRKLVIGGPESLSFRDAAIIYGRILGREIAVRTVMPGDPVPGIHEAVGPLLAGFDAYDSIIDMSELNREFAVTPTSLEEYARRSVARAQGS